MRRIRENLKKDEFSRNGTFYFEISSAYSGEWKDDLKHAQGNLTYSSYDRGHWQGLIGYFDRGVLKNGSSNLFISDLLTG